MEILGIGMSELIFIAIIALLILGPKDMQKAGRTIGKWLRNIVMSDGWKTFQQTSRELRNLPTKLMRDANEELNQIGQGLKDVSNPPQKWGSTIKPGPRSQPYSPEKAPAESVETIATPEIPEQTEPESDPKKDA